MRQSRKPSRTHASGGVSEGAPFGFLSHGVGSQFMALVAYRLKQEPRWYGFFWEKNEAKKEPKRDKSNRRKEAGSKNSRNCIDVRSLLTKHGLERNIWFSNFTPKPFLEVAPCSKRYHRQTSARWYAESFFLRYLSSAAFLVLTFGKLHIATCTLMECTWHNSSCIALDLWRALHTHWIRRHLLYQWFESTGRSWIWSHWWFLPTMGHHPTSLHCQRRDIKNCHWTAPKLATWNRSHVVKVLGWCFLKNQIEHVRR